MKKTLALLLSLCLLAGLALSLISCSNGPRGEYAQMSGTTAGGAKTVYDFSGDNVTMTITVYVGGKETVTRYEGTYTLEENEEDGTSTITFDMKDVNGEKAELQSGARPFVMAHDGSFIKIGDAKYDKQ